MALARMRRGESGMNYWPGFVDALSTLILSIIFILTVFVVVQFYLQQEVAGKDTALTRLNVQIAQLTARHFEQSQIRTARIAVYAFPDDTKEIFIALFHPFAYDAFRVVQRQAMFENAAQCKWKTRKALKIFKCFVHFRRICNSSSLPRAVRTGTCSLRGAYPLRKTACP